MTSILHYQWTRVIFAIVVAALMAACANAPTEQLAVSKAAVANAVDTGAPEFAPVEMRSAQEKMDRANQAMAAKKYDQAQWMAQQAQVDAQLAVTKTRAAKAEKASSAVQDDSRVLREEMDRRNK
ncbi:MAG TPA: DUF4398 domain-containing protein [Burkholderiales bacterium]|nr:DUF4398 domain-containing protein [Burkholderiales bacterium]